MSYSVKDFHESYPFSADPRDMQLSLDNHTYWEEDNRVEERYQWGAQILDLCGLSVDEYMKNPILEALNDIKEAISGYTPTPVPPVPSGDTEDDVDFYYASINNLSAATQITMSMFTKLTGKTGTAVEVPFVLGDPDEDDINYVKEHDWSDESKMEIMAKKANTYYLIIPSKYDYDGLVLVDEEGLIKQEEEISREVAMVDCPEGYSLIGIVDIDNFNPMWPISRDVQTKYNITFIKTK